MNHAPLATDRKRHRERRQAGVPRSACAVGDGRCFEYHKGWGTHRATWLPPTGHSVRRLDDPPEALSANHDLLTDDVEPLGLFDVVHARFVLHHLGERAADGLRRLVTLLAPGGRVLIEDPLWDNRYDPSYPNAATLQAEADEFEVATVPPD